LIKRPSFFAAGRSRRRVQRFDRRVLVCHDRLWGRVPKGIDVDPQVQRVPHEVQGKWGFGENTNKGKNRKTEIQRDRKNERKNDRRQKDRRQKDRDRETERQRNRTTEGKKNRTTERQKDIKIQRDRGTESQRERENERKKEGKKHNLFFQFTSNLSSTILC